MPANSPADCILSRLDHIWSRGPRSWLAKCPGHKDKSPSLSIREASDGTLLLKCFAGCSIDVIVAAIGLELSDLFPHDSHEDYGPPRKPNYPRFPWRDAIKALKYDLSAISIGAALCAADDLSEQDCIRLAKASSRIRDLLDWL